MAVDVPTWVWLGSSHTSFMDTDICSSCSFHVTWDIIRLIFLQLFKNMKTTLSSWVAGPRWWAEVARRLWFAYHCPRSWQHVVEVGSP